MAEIWFYHLQRAGLGETVVKLVLKARQAGWRVCVQVSTPERREALDDLLWTFEEDSFLAHGVDADPDAAEEDVLIALDAPDLNRPDALVLVDGAPLPQDPGRYRRVILLFDGADDEAVAAARERWRFVKAAGHEASYWAQDERGGWIKKA